eukprot:13784_1
MHKPELLNCSNRFLLLTWLLNCFVNSASSMYVVNQYGNDINNNLCDENNPCGSLNNALWSIHLHHLYNKSAQYSILITGINTNESNLNCSFNLVDYNLTITIKNGSSIINNYCTTQLLNNNKTKIIQSENNIVINNLFYTNNNIGLIKTNSFVCNNCTFDAIYSEHSIIESHHIIFDHSVFNNIHIQNKTFINCIMNSTDLFISNTQFTNLLCHNVPLIDCQNAN